MILKEKWGIPVFDENVGGLSSFGFNVVETPDHRTGLALLGHFLYEGLKDGEICAIASFEDPLAFIENFNVDKFDFAPYLKSGQLIFLNYEPDVSLKVGLTQDYRAIFDEIEFLAGSAGVRRTAIAQLDTLFSLHSNSIITACAQKLVTSIGENSQTVLGQFVQFNDMVHRELSIACQKTSHAFFSLEGKAQNEITDLYQLTTLKAPWFAYDDQPIDLSFTPGEGFEYHSTKKIKTAV